MKNSRLILVAAGVLVLSALAAYRNSLAVPFVFDDEPSILQNPSITRLWPLSGPLSPPQGYGFTVSGRPVLNLTLALNYALSGTAVRGYHLTNLLIHVLAGLALLGLVRRTLELPTPGRAEYSASGALRPTPEIRPVDPLWTAFAVALLWTLHPLQTESVTYTIQRAESLMGLCYLLTLYCFVRAVQAVRPGWWSAGAIAACTLGTGCKEVIVTAPVVVLFFDRTFVSGSFRSAWRQRWPLHAGLLATWLPLGWLVLGTGSRGGTFDFTAAAFGQYGLTQFEAVARYLQLSVWPSPLVFEYGVAEVKGLAAIAWYAAVVLLAAGGSLWALGRRPAAGFLGVSFFLILAPTSLVPGVMQVIVEHRMYLPLAALLILVGVGVAGWLGRRGLCGLLALAVGAGWLTFRRNADYATDLRLWNDSVAKRPSSSLAQSGLGTAYYKLGNFPAAVRHLQMSILLNPAVARTHYNLGLALDKSDRPGDAAAQYAEAVRLVPYFSAAQAELGAMLLRLGRPAEAVDHLQTALAVAPDQVEAYNSLGQALAALGQVTQAVAAYEKALKLKPDLADVHFNLGVAQMAAGQPQAAMTHYAEAVRLKPAHAEARLNLGILQAQSGRNEEALANLQAAVQLKPRMAEAQANLGIMLAEMGRTAEAVDRYEEALRLRPDYAVARYNLGNALLQEQRWTEAKRQFAAAVRIAPGFGAAREMLERMQAVPDIP